MGNYEDDYKKLLDERDRSAPTSHPVMGTDRLLDVNEEMAADFAVSGPVVHTERREDRYVEKSERSDTRSGGFALGWVALVFAIASWFIWPVLIGATATVLGFMAYRQGARGLGGWSMAIGLIALALNLIIVPFYYAIT
ncbi:DUF4190 domain-containing protein [Paenibacillus sp. LHD-38]|uniref:DUF4190 domain-containing protein n=1 Tax=Paenibacillus sp. LHD-38 TaxID=3072143 RepID=UPI00280C9A47|nr:DUF4190 domain-containing protein [Paenibacillus sp. LHD-38]MDQ8736686.1 DUF4190 domain-containing protein [Paenibacillus sp. LHD-38]